MWSYPLKSRPKFNLKATGYHAFTQVYLSWGINIISAISITLADPYILYPLYLFSGKHFIRNIMVFWRGLKRNSWQASGLYIYELICWNCDWQIKYTFFRDVRFRSFMKWMSPNFKFKIYFTLKDLWYKEWWAKIKKYQWLPKSFITVWGTQNLALFLNTAILNGQSPRFFTIYETTKMMTIDRYTTKNKKTRWKNGSLELNSVQSNYYF